APEEFKSSRTRPTLCASVARNVRAGRCRELGLADHDCQGFDGSTAPAQQSDGDSQRRHSVVAALTPEQFAGPGVAHVGYGEYNQRHLLDRWADYLDTDDEVEVQVASIGTGITNNGEAPA
ncbi:hypothetical protein AB1285_22955, partial [Microbacterium sp. NRRL B-14842]